MLASVVSIVAALVALSALWRTRHGSTSGLPAPTPPYDDSDLRKALIDLAEDLDEIRADYAEFRALVTEAVDNAIRDVTRKENRIRATVRRAREEFEESGHLSPGLEAEATELFGADGEGSGQGRVPPVPNGVAAGEPQRSFAAFPGDWSGFGG